MLAELKNEGRREETKVNYMEVRIVRVVRTTVGAPHAR